jgi:hypothetical protein
VSRLSPQDLLSVAPHVPFSPAGAISVAELSRRLGVSVSTAGRRLKEWANANRLTLHSVRVREGARGPQSARWFASVTPSESASRPVAVAAPLRPQPVDTSRVSALKLPPPVMSALEPDELQAIALLSSAGGVVRPSDLAARIGRRPDRMEGMLYMLRRKLFRLGIKNLPSSKLDDGETMFQWIKPNGA